MVSSERLGVVFTGDASCGTTRSPVSTTALLQVSIGEQLWEKLSEIIAYDLFVRLYVRSESRSRSSASQFFSFD